MPEESQPRLGYIPRYHYWIWGIIVGLLVILVFAATHGLDTVRDLVGWVIVISLLPVAVLTWRDAFRMIMPKEKLLFGGSKTRRVKWDPIPGKPGYFVASDYIPENNDAEKHEEESRKYMASLKDLQKKYGSG